MSGAREGAAVLCPFGGDTDGEPVTNFDFMALDGGTLSELLAVPVIVAAWILVVAFLDRWVRKGVDRE